jgi:hypothetical protein
LKVEQINHKKITIESNSLEHEAMSIDPTALNHIMSVLTTLYSEPAWAVLREVVSNGLDAHVKANSKKPVEITLPSYSNNHTLTVRDFGHGMTKKQISKIYRLYGASTKREDNVQVGGFGLGAKSPLALAQRFDVISVAKHRGKPNELTEFYIEKDSFGVGQVFYVRHEETDLPSGVEVRVPYGEDYGYKIQDSKTVSTFFLGLSYNAILINGEAPTNNLNIATQYDSLGTIQGELNVWMSGEEEKVQKGYSNKLNVIIGGIHYPVSYDWLRSSPHSDFFYELVRKIYIEVPIGALDLVPSREDLIYSERTTEALNSLIEHAITLMHTKFKNDLNRATNRTEAVEEFLRIREVGYIKANELLWRGEQVLVDQPLHLNAAMAIAPHGIGRGRRGRGASNSIVQKLSAAKEHVLSREDYLKRDDNKVIIVEGDPEEITKVSRHMKFASRVMGIYNLIIMQKLDYDNPWFQYSHNENYKTVADFTKAVAVARRTERVRLATNEITSEKGYTRPVGSKPFAFIWKPKADGSYSVEQAYKEDPEVIDMFADNIFYIQEGNNNDSVLVPYFPLSLTTGKETYNSNVAGHRDNGKNELYAIILEITGGKPVMLFSRRQRPETILDGLKAQPLAAAVKEYAKKHFTPSKNYTWSEFCSIISYDQRSTLNKMMQTYKAFEKEGMLDRITNERFLQIGEFIEFSNRPAKIAETEEEIEAERRNKNLMGWAGYSRSQDPDLLKLIEKEVERLNGIASHFPLLVEIYSIKPDQLEHILAYIEADLPPIN